MKKSAAGSVVLGIDPGTHRVGYGVVLRVGGSVRFVAAGILPVRGKDPASRLREIKQGADRLLENFAPSCVAVEKLFFSKNVKTGMSVAEARGVLLLAAAERGVPIREYGPGEIKVALTGYGLADKAAVLKMVRATLKEPRLRVLDDASDALAAAILGARDLPRSAPRPPLDRRKK